LPIIQWRFKAAFNRGGRGKMLFNAHPIRVRFGPPNEGQRLKGAQVVEMLIENSRQK